MDLFLKIECNRLKFIKIKITQRKGELVEISREKVTWTSIRGVKQLGSVRDTKKPSNNECNNRPS
jgi:hypothetical protein